MSKAIHISDETYAEITEYAQQGGMEIKTATEKLLRTAFGRIRALASYSKKSTGKDPVPRNPKAIAKRKAAAEAAAKPAKKAKKAPAKKASKKATAKAPRTAKKATRRRRKKVDQ